MEIQILVLKLCCNSTNIYIYIYTIYILKARSGIYGPLAANGGGCLCCHLTFATNVTCGCFVAISLRRHCATKCLQFEIKFSFYYFFFCSQRFCDKTNNFLVCDWQQKVTRQRHMPRPQGPQLGTHVHTHTETGTLANQCVSLYSHANICVCVGVCVLGFFF